MDKQKRYIAYIRVSTKKQGQSGLGLDAQLESIKSYVDQNNGVLIEPPFEEKESGRKDNRPELKRALEFAIKNDCILCVAKLDRLSRSVRFFAEIQESKVKFEIVGLPANPFVLSILSCVAEWEAKAISQRTKSALSSLKNKGVKLGYDLKPVRVGIKKYWEKKRLELKKQPKVEKQTISKREQSDRIILPHIRLMRSENKTFKSITKALNDSGFKTRSGKLFHLKQVHRIAQRNNVA